MLQFLRAHQKGIFLCVAVVVICSFFFFGTYGALDSRVDSKSQDHVAFYAMDGSEVRESDIEDLSHLLNGWGSAFFAKEFISTGLGMMVAERYMPQIESEIQERLHRARRYVPYVHKEIPFLNVQTIWSHFVPGMTERVSFVQKGEGGISHLCGALFLLYMDQIRLPPEQVKQILSYYMSQYGRVKPDAHFAHYDPALFGFHSVEEWFGPTWLRLMARVMINGSVMARQAGYSVPFEEALALFPDVQGRERYAKLWQKVMEFALYSASVGRSVLVDPLICAQFASYAQESVQVDLYALPEELQIQTFFDVLKAKLYDEIQTIPLAFVEKKYPELIEEGLELVYRETSRQELAAEVSLKQMWQWQMEDEGWAVLVDKKGLPYIADKTERFAYLESMDAKKRLEVDECAQVHMLGVDRIDRALRDAEEKRIVWGLRRAGLAGLKDLHVGEDIVPLVRLASLDGEEENEAARALHRFSSDGMHFYKISVVGRCRDKQLVSFAQSVRDGSLDAALHRKLKEAYPEVRKKYPSSFKEDNGQWRSFEEVEEVVGRYVYADFLRTLLPEEPARLEAYAYAYQLAFLNKVRELVKKGEAGPYTEGFWHIEKKEKVVTRSKGLSPAEERFLELAEGELSPVEKGSTESPCFAKIIRHSGRASIDGAFVERVQSPLDLDARRCVWQLLLQEIDNKKAI